MLPRIEKAKQIRASMAVQAQDIESGTIVSRDGDYSTVAVHDGLEIDKLATQAALIRSDEFSTATGGPSVSELGNKAVDSWMDITTVIGTPTEGLQEPVSLSVSPEQNLKGNSIPQAMVGKGDRLNDASLTSETVSRKATDKVPLPPSVYQRLTSSPTLMNLDQALAYHKMCYEEMPLPEIQAAQEEQTIQDLSDNR